MTRRGVVLAFLLAVSTLPIHVLTTDSSSSSSSEPKDLHHYPPSPPGPYTPPPGFPKAVPRGVLDVGLPPRERWNHLVDDAVKTHGWDNTFKHVIGYWESLIPFGLRHLTLALANAASKYFDGEYMQELIGAVDRINLYKPNNETYVSVPMCLVMNIVYELSAGCTSIIANDQNGTIWHGRALDWPLPPSIRFTNLTYLLDVVNSTSSTLLYRGLHNIGFIGANTGMKPKAFSVTMDERKLPNFKRVIIDNIAHMVEDRATPVTWLMREALCTNETFSEAVAEVSTFTIGAPAYLIVGGRKNEEGIIVTRTWNESVLPLALPDGPTPWYLVQTNYDHWKTPPAVDNRRGLAEAALDTLGQDGMDVKGMAKVLQTQGNNDTRGVLNADTMYTVVMSAELDIIEAWLWQ